MTMHTNIFSLKVRIIDTEKKKQKKNSSWKKQNLRRMIKTPPHQSILPHHWSCLHHHILSCFERLSVLSVRSAWGGCTPVSRQRWQGGGGTLPPALPRTPSPSDRSVQQRFARSRGTCWPEEGWVGRTVPAPLGGKKKKITNKTDLKSWYDSENLRPSSTSRHCCMTMQDVCLMSDGLPLTHIWAVFDRSVSEGDGYQR